MWLLDSAGGWGRGAGYGHVDPSGVVAGDHVGGSDQLNSGLDGALDTGASDPQLDLAGLDHPGHVAAGERESARRDREVDAHRLAGSEGDPLEAEQLGHRAGDRRDHVVGVQLEVAGNDDAVRTAIAAARPGGTVVLVGIPAEDSTTFPASVARRKGLTLKLSRRMNETYARTMSLVERGTVDVASLVTHVFALDEVAQAFRTAEQRSGLKVVVVPGTQGNASEDRAVAGSVHHEG